MALPKFDYPPITITVPSTGKQMLFRPFLVREEKVLMMAKESQDPVEVMLAVRQIVTNCAQDPKFDVDNIALFDLEYIFMKLIASSVNSVIKMTYRDTEDDKEYQFDIDLMSITIDVPKIDFRVPITESSGLVLKYPSVVLLKDSTLKESDKDFVYRLLIRCIDKIYNGDDVVEARDIKEEEIEDFMDGLDIKTADRLKKFILDLPVLSHTITYKNSLGHDRRIDIRGLNDFFMFF